jgi:acylphosphatase
LNLEPIHAQILGRASHFQRDLFRLTAGFSGGARASFGRGSRRIEAGDARFHPAMISLQVFFEGYVQGVGFRWSVRQIAKGFDVIGWVRNLADGRVELQASGEEAEVRAFLEAIGRSELRTHIRKQTESMLAEPPRTRGFEIRHE